MPEIYVRENKSIEEALVRFKRACDRAGMPSRLRKKKQKVARKRLKSIR